MSLLVAALGDVTNRKALPVHEETVPSSQKSAVAKPRRPLGDISNRSAKSSGSSSQKDAGVQQLPPVERFFPVEEAALPLFDCSGLKPEELVQTALNKRTPLFAQPSGAALFDPQSWQAYDAALLPSPPPPDELLADLLPEADTLPESFALNLDLTKLQLSEPDAEDSEHELAPPLQERDASDSMRAPHCCESQPEVVADAREDDHTRGVATPCSHDGDVDMELDDD